MGVIFILEHAAPYSDGNAGWILCIIFDSLCFRCCFVDICRWDGGLNSPVQITRLMRFFFCCDQTTNHQDSELLSTNYFVSVCTHASVCMCIPERVYMCVHAFMCAGLHRQVCKQERREWARENMIIFVWVNELLTRVTKSLTAKAWEALLVCVWYVQYVQRGIWKWYVYYVY